MRLSDHLRPNRAKRHRENLAREQRNRLFHQSAQQSEAARIHRDNELAKIKIQIEEIKAEIEAWYNAELTKANADYCQKHTEYQNTLVEINESQHEVTLKLCDRLKLQQADLIANHSSDAEFLEQCYLVVNQLAIEAQAHYAQHQLESENQDVRQLIAVTQGFQQELVVLKSHYAQIIQQVEVQWLDYQEQYNKHLADLKAARDAQLSAVDVYETEQIAKIEAAYQENLVAINQELRLRLQEVDNALQEQLKHMKHAARALIFTALTIVVASVAAYFTAGMLAGFSAYIIDMAQATLALTSLRATERLVNGSDSVGIDVSINLAPQPAPRKFTPAIAPNVELEPAFIDSTFNLEQFEQRFKEFGQNIQLDASNDLFFPKIQSSDSPFTVNTLEEGIGKSVLIGSGRFLVETGQGIKQLSLQCGAEIGIVEPEVVANYTQDINKERELYQRTPVANSVAGKVGEFGTELLVYSVVPAGVGLRGAKLAAAGAASGGLVTGIQPTYDGSWGTRGQNVAAGAVTGAVVAPVAGMLYAPAKKSMVTLYDATLAKKPFGSKTYSQLDWKYASKKLNDQQIAGGAKNGQSGILFDFERQTSTINASSPAEIYYGYGKLSKRQQIILDNLPSDLSEFKLHKSDINVNDLAALTAYTKEEFALFTRGSQRKVVRGNKKGVDLSQEELKKLKLEGFRWSAHTHPGIKDIVLNASGDPGDRAVLQLMSQERSLILNSAADRNVFDLNNNLRITEYSTDVTKFELAEWDPITRVKL